MAAVPPMRTGLDCAACVVAACADVAYEVARDVLVGWYEPGVAGREGVHFYDYGATARELRAALRFLGVPSRLKFETCRQVVREGWGLDAARGAALVLHPDVDAPACTMGHWLYCDAGRLIDPGDLQEWTWEEYSSSTGAHLHAIVYLRTADDE